MANGMWHARKKKSLWNGTVTFWCGLTVDARDSLSEYWYLGPAAPKCPACKTAKQAAGKK